MICHINWRELFWQFGFQIAVVDWLLPRSGLVARAVSSCGWSSCIAQLGPSLSTTMAGKGATSWNEASDKGAGVVPSGVQVVTFFWSAVGGSASLLEFQFCFGNDVKMLNCLRWFICYKNSLREPQRLMQGFLIFCCKTFYWALSLHSLGAPDDRITAFYSESQYVCGQVHTLKNTRNKAQTLKVQSEKRVSHYHRNPLTLCNLYTEAGVNHYLWFFIISNEFLAG